MTEKERHSIVVGRRNVLKTCVAVGGVALLSGADAFCEKVAGVAGEPLHREGGITPPCAASREDFLRRCTACGLCIEKCPTGVLRPATDEYGIANAMKPTMVFDKSFCRTVCNRCGIVCPTGALRPLSESQRKRNAVGKAEINLSACISAARGVSCGVCSRRCPVEAIKMSEVGERERPSVETFRCIGCGACEYICPADAIIVNPV